MAKVIITPRSYGMFNPEVFTIWKDEGYEVIRKTGPLPEEELAELIKDADALVVGTDRVSKRVLDTAGKLKLISKYGVGTDNIDKEFAELKGIAVVNTPGVNTEAVADYAFGLMLSLARHIVKSHHDLIEKGKWEKTVGLELYGKKLGLLGFGAIGSAVARRAKGFNMDVIAYDPFPNHTLATELGVTFADLETVLQESDVVSMHLPLMPETKNLISRTQLSVMKKHCLLINTARGGVVDETALYEAMKEGEIGGAALDVFQEEPPLKSPLFALDNVILTSHNASASVEAIQRMTMQSTENVLRFFNTMEKV
ncbi:phosphoglycerate dehydrogenase [Rossellomorea vietnamensis]|uniref:phosphoglycerate dehydrogenase n=1 Tax=Rossellomorea vietnamensis TaxID=218284 RepID=UPI001E4FCEDA|nr:phosphoglycerate dehydrogenase [Rossellomorea vietnamensis]MCC5801767.1 phosphoglycerate dehydrogenase [Rossellomorea vietnamensis]